MIMDVQQNMFSVYGWLWMFNKTCLQCMGDYGCSTKHVYSVWLNMDVQQNMYTVYMWIWMFNETCLQCMGVDGCSTKHVYSVWGMNLMMDV